MELEKQAGQIKVSIWKKIILKYNILTYFLKKVQNFIKNKNKFCRYLYYVLRDFFR